MADDSVPQYLAPNDDGTHQVQATDGSVLNIPWGSLTPDLKIQAYQQTKPAPATPAPVPAPTPVQVPVGAGDGSPDLFQMGTKQQTALHQAINSAPIGAQQAQAIQASMGVAPAQPAPTPVDPLASLQTSALAPTPQASAASTPVIRPGGAGGGFSSAGLTAAEKAYLAARQAQGGADFGVDNQTAKNIDAASKLLAVQQAEDRQHSMGDLGKADAANAASGAPMKSMWDGLTTGQKFLTGLGAFFNAVGPAVGSIRMPTGPGHYGDNSSAIFGGIGAGAAALGFGANYAGTGSPTALNEQISNYISSETADRKGKGEMSTRYRELASQYQAQGKTDDEASTAATAALKEAAQLHVAANAAKVMGPEAGVKLYQDLREDSLKRANTAQAYGSARNSNAEAQGKELDNQQKAALTAAQQNINRGHAYVDLPADQQSAYLADAAKNEKLLPGIGVAQRKITPEENGQQQAIQEIGRLRTEIDGLTQNTGFNMDNRIQATAKAKVIKELLPKALGTTGARPSEGLDSFLGGVVPENPGDFTTRWSAYSNELGSLAKNSERGLHDNLGVQKFDPDVSVVGPQGQTGTVPRSKLRDAARRGFKAAR